MKQIKTEGIILSRTNYNEADKILTFLTPDYGKITAIAKGVRKNGSRLAGSIELFSISQLGFVLGRGKIYTLISARLIEHWGNIIKDPGCLQLAYDFIRITNKATEDSPEKAYFDLLKNSLEALDDEAVEPDLVSLWFQMQLLKHSGHSPDLRSDVTGHKLGLAQTYTFNFNHMKFSPQAEKQNVYSAKDIKFLRLGFSASKPQLLTRIEDAKNYCLSLQPLISAMLNQFVKI